MSFEIRAARVNDDDWPPSGVSEVVKWTPEDDAFKDDPDVLRRLKREDVKMMQDMFKRTMKLEKLFEMLISEKNCFAELHTTYTKHIVDSVNLYNRTFTTFYGESMYVVVLLTIDKFGKDDTTKTQAHDCLVEVLKPLAFSGNITLLIRVSETNDFLKELFKKHCVDFMVASLPGMRGIKDADEDKLAIFNHLRTKHKEDFNIDELKTRLLKKYDDAQDVVNTILSQTTSSTDE
jgi:hypothetical protein